MYYSEVIKKSYPTFGNGPAGYFISTFRKVDFDEKLLIRKIEEIDFEFEEGEDCLNKRVDLIKKAVKRAGYSPTFPTLLGAIIGLFGIGVLWQGDNLIVTALCLLSSLLVAGLYCLFRIRFEIVQERLLACLDHVLECWGAPLCLEV